jgi:hypothetical protein
MTFIGINSTAYPRRPMFQHGDPQLLRPTGSEAAFRAEVRENSEIC